MERIGLEAVFDTAGFKKGVLEYIPLIGKTNQANDLLADSLTRLGADFTMLEGDVARMAARMKASTPENVKFTQQYQKIVTEFEKGKITSKQAAAALDKLQAEMKQTGSAGKTSTPSIKMFWTELNSMIGVAKQAAQAIIRTATEVYNFGKAGAELENVEFKFNRLALTIGSSGDVIKEKLSEVMDGLLSEADQMALVTDLMSLGLVKTEDTAVRMANVVGQMGMDTNELVLTLTNRTLRRFDQLGVATDGFKERLKGLEDQGMDTEAAFTEAFLQQAEAQLERVGGIADQNIGTFMKFEAAIKDVSNAWKKDFSTSIAPAVEWLTEFILKGKEANKVMQDAEIELRTNTDSYEDYTKKVIATRVATGLLTQEEADKISTYVYGLPIMTEAIDETDMLTKAQYDLANQSPETAARQKDLNDRISGYQPIVEDAVEDTETYEEALEKLREETRKAEEEQRALAEATAAAAAAAREATIDYYDLVEALSQEVDETDLAKAALDRLDQAYADGLISTEAYIKAKENLGFAYDIITPKGILYEKALTDATTALGLGIIPSEKYGKAHELAMGMVEDGTFTMGGFISALIGAGLTSETSAAQILLSEGVMNQLDLDPAIEETGALVSNLAYIAQAPETKSFWYTVTTTYVKSGAGQGSGLMGMAEGGQVSGGTPYIVGDGGQSEVFVPGSDGYVFPSISEFEGAFARAMQGNGGTTNYSMNMNVSPSQAGQVSQNFGLMKLMR